ncbi:IclR family transcriptional regulator [Streptomyces sp. NPDC051994]|uniref:IclR family transcriptional regulator n=1 Tax=unclassified Streptomyces TaxID=2593676 RepID=UPI00344191CF
MTTSTPERATSTAATSRRALSGVGVLDKASLLLDVVESGPATLGKLVAKTGIKRPTAHRLALALERLGMLSRDGQGRFVTGPRLGGPANQAWQERLLRNAEPVLGEIRDRTGVDVRLYRRQGELHTCVSSAEATTDPRRSVPVGAMFPMKSGSVPQVLLAWESPEELHRVLRGARFSATTLAGVRRKGWAQCVDDWDPGTVSVSAPIRTPDEGVVAAISLSGPLVQLSSTPGPRFSRTVLNAAAHLSSLAR